MYKSPFFVNNAIQETLVFAKLFTARRGGVQRKDWIFCMKAIIMAGGVGSRLRPLTCTLPKPMARLCSRPVLEYILDILCEHSFDEAVLTLKYLPDCIMDYFPDNKYKGMKLSFSIEENALGTAGSVKLAAKKIDKPFLVISGDALCNYDLGAIMKYHRNINADATIVCKRVDDPREYGLVNCDPKGRIQGFTEKPGWEQVSTNLANTGIYVLNPSVLNLIEDNKSVDFACDVFPEMLKSGRELYAYDAQGYWCDIGDFEAYKSCQFDLIRGIDGLNTVNHADNVVHQAKTGKGIYSIIQPVFLGENVTIGKNSSIGPNVVVDNDVTIGENSRINNSVILQGAYIAGEARINSSIICEDAIIKKNADIFEGTVIGSSSVIGENATIGNNVYIWPEKTIEKNSRINDNIREGSLNSDMLDNDALSGECFSELSCERGARIGAAVGSVKDGKRVGVGCDDSAVSKTMNMAVVAGLLSSGSAVWDFGRCFHSQLNYFLTYCGLKLGMFVSTEENITSIRVIGENALTLERKTERDISSRYKRRDFIKCPAFSCSEMTDMSSLYLMYRRELLSIAQNSFTELNVSVRCENSRIQKYISEILSNLGCGGGNALSDEDGNAKESAVAAVFMINETGELLQAFDENGSYISPETLLSVCCLEEFLDGRDVCVAYDAPKIINELAEKSGKKVYRYTDSASNNESEELRQKIQSSTWVRDALFMLVKLLNNMSKTEKSLYELISELPTFAVTKKVLEIDIAPSNLLDIFSSLRESGNDSLTQGITISSKNGEVRLTTSKNGKNLRIISESFSEEYSNELCLEIEEKIKAECKKLGNQTLI